LFGEASLVWDEFFVTPSLRAAFYIAPALSTGEPADCRRTIFAILGESFSDIYQIEKGGFPWGKK
jgi:hypothetical protein